MRSFVGAVIVIVLVACGDRREIVRSSEGPAAHEPTAALTSAPAATTPAVAPPARCTLRVSVRGLYVDGDPTSQADAIEICKSRTAAIVILEDGVAKGDWQKVEAALRREGIETMMRGPLGHAECVDNPLEKGCP
jgi:hypothetical protein